MNTETFQTQMQRGELEAAKKYAERLQTLRRQLLDEAKDAQELANHLNALLLTAISGRASSDTLTQLRRSITDATWQRSMARAHVNLAEIRLIWLRSGLDQ